MMTSFAVGDLTIHRIVELVAPLRPALHMMPKLTPELLEEYRGWMQPDSLGPNDCFMLTYQSYIVRTPHHVILVDSCLGNHKPRGSASAYNMKTDATYMKGLAAAGLTVDDIDYVMCTHLHMDHVGWNTQLVDGRWVPTFPKARYIFGRREYQSIKERHERDGYPAFLDSVLPIVEQGRADLVSEDFALGDHVRLIPTFGHTDGHVAVCFGKQRDEAVMTGDLIHVPLQMRYPELSFERDRDPVQSAVTRRNFLERFCDAPTVCCTAHFPSPSVGRIRRWADGFRLEALE